MHADGCQGYNEQEQECHGTHGHMNFTAEQEKSNTYGKQGRDTENKKRRISMSGADVFVLSGFLHAFV